MDLLGMADPGSIPADAITGFAFGVIRILAFGALGVAFAGIVLTIVCDLFECRRPKRVPGPRPARTPATETWQLMP